MLLSLIVRIIPIYEQNSLWSILAQWKLLLASRWYSPWSVSLFICYYFVDFPKYLHVFHSISMVCIVLSMVCVVFMFRWYLFNNSLFDSSAVRTYFWAWSWWDSLPVSMFFRHSAEFSSSFRSDFNKLLGIYDM